MKVRLVALFLFIAFTSLPMHAKDKQYEDATVVKVDHMRPTMALAKEGAGGGSLLAKQWYLDVKLGGLTYSVHVEDGKVKDGDFDPDAVVKVRLDKSAGMLVSKSKMYILNSKDKDKEIETLVYSLRDKDGTEYCKTLKCDYGSAEKKAQESK